ncbi:MAG: hypothetical protein MI810_10630 [Flavobacteriales bacterium]|jgi:hypothetical protein|nr:hypothetical protein [Flavobacteriales bacterium]
MILILTSITILSIAVIFLLTSRKEVVLFGIKQGNEILKKVSILALIQCIGIGFYYSPTSGIILMAVAAFYACLIAFFQKQFLWVTLGTLFTTVLLTI